MHGKNTRCAASCGRGLTRGWRGRRRIMARPPARFVPTKRRLSLRFFRGLLSAASRTLRTRPAARPGAD